MFCFADEILESINNRLKASKTSQDKRNKPRTNVVDQFNVVYFVEFVMKNIYKPGYLQCGERTQTKLLWPTV